MSESERKNQISERYRIQIRNADPEATVGEYWWRILDTRSDNIVVQQSNGWYDWESQAIEDAQEWIKENDPEIQYWYDA